MSERDKLADRIRESMYVGHDTPGELADEVLDMGYIRVSADEDTVERVGDAIADSIVPPLHLQERRIAARAAFNAIGDEDDKG